MGVLGLLLGCWVLGAWGTWSPSTHMYPPEGLWVRLGTPFSLQCEGSCPTLIILRRGAPSPLATGRETHVAWNRDGAAANDSGTYTCRCHDPPGPPPAATPDPHPGPGTHQVPVVVTDPKLLPPKLWLPLPQPVPVPRGGNVTLVCEGPEVSGTFWLYREGPKWLVEQKEVLGGGNVTFNLGPLQPPDEGPYVCTYRPNGSAMGSAPSRPLLLPVQGGDTSPERWDWPGCEYWMGRR